MGSNPIPPGGGTPPGAPPGGGAPPNPPIDPNSINALHDMVAKFADIVVELKDAMKDGSGQAGRLSRDLDTVGLRYTAIADSAGDIKDILGELFAENKKLTTGIFSAKSVGKTKETLEKVLDAHKKIAARVGMTTQQQTILNQAVRKTSHTLKEIDDYIASMVKGTTKLEDVMSSAFDDTMLLSMNKHLREGSSLVDKLTESFKTFHSGPVTKTSQTINQLLGRSGRLEKFTRIGQVAHDTRQAVKSGRSLNKDMFQAHLKSHGGLLDLPFDATGNIDLAALKASAAGRRGKGGTGAKYSEAIKAMSGVGGPMGMVDRFIGNRILRNAVERGEGGMGLKLMNLGGGSLTRGAGSLMEGGVGEFMGAAGKMAIPLAAIGAVKDIFDKVAKMNADVEKGLGGAGIFSGTGGGFNTFQNVKDNLNAQGSDKFYSGLNVTYERQLNVAKAMAESGVGLADLANKGGGSTVRGIAHTAFVGARLAGLDEMEGTKEIMKLLQQYHMTIQGTDTFFDKLNKDTRAAGITTSKYLQIIDEVTGGFNHMARSIDDITGTLRILGHTGTQTAEMVKDSMTSMLGPEGRGLEQRSYLTASLLDDSDARESFIGGQKATALSSGQKALEALTLMGLDTSGMTAEMLATPEGVMHAKALLAQSNTGDATQRQTAGATLQQALHDSMRLSNATENLRSGNITGFAAGQDILGGASPAERFMLQNRAMAKLAQTVYGENGWRNAMKNPGSLMKDPLFLSKMASEGLGSKPEDLLNNITTYQNMASSLVGSAAHGKGSHGSYVKLAGLAKEMGIATTGDTAEEQIQGLKNNSEALAKLSEGMAENINIMNQVYNDSDLRNALDPGAEDKKAQEDKARGVAIATRQTADIFAAAFTNLFVSISTGVTYIGEILENWAGKTWGKDGAQFRRITDEERTAEKNRFSDPSYMNTIQFLTQMQDKLSSSDKPEDKAMFKRINDALAGSDKAFGDNLYTQAGIDNEEAYRKTATNLAAALEKQYGTTLSKDIQLETTNPVASKGDVVNGTANVGTAPKAGTTPVSQTTINQTGIQVYDIDLSAAVKGTNKSGEGNTNRTVNDPVRNK
jgi:hypothetical protein